jgi:hypothetical protein
MWGHRQTRQYQLLALLLVCTTLGSNSGRAQEVRNPDPRIQAYVRDSAGRIRELRNIIENQGAEIQDRRAALSQLGLISEDVAVDVAAKLVNDPAQEVALAAVDVLSNATVMAGHGDVPSDHHGVDHPSFETPWMKYVKAEHEIVRSALRAAARDARPQIALTALKSLVRLSDEVAIKDVTEAASRGEITEAAAVSICAQSASDLGRACVIDFLDHGSLDGKIAAIGVLGSLPSARPVIRNKIFLNSNADPKLRSAAADVLSIYDPSFTSYALTVTADPKIPTEVYASALKGYAVGAHLGGKLDSAQWTAIKEALDNKLKAVEGDPNTDSTTLRNLRDKFSTGRPEL